ncbi:LysE family transporter [Chitinophagaceae bacterium LB-8]|jgi:threonine/homoserine/homoserine lactone efflux protein|uniref:LysE family transporter n=1 Tax=Paraflavisolibacter caeni TaxID=2982496 RepID=A0A9X2XY78_9BACT|nr:LysE family transporter [Paraflavisolibacter caeni]MCU7550930.1 LysE family transporter [Paraflavisolibacter caeni]
MLEAIWKGTTLGLLLSISVGPVIFSILKQSINNGIKGGLAFIIGVSFSDITLAVASNMFTELFSEFGERKTEIGIVGSTFLISVGIYYLFFKKVIVNEHGHQILKVRKRDYLKLLLAGYFMNILNPAIIVFWLTTSTAFVSHTTQERIVIFSIALALVVIGDITKVLLAGKLRRRLTAKNIHLINRINGVIFIGFGIALLVGLLFYGNKLPQ